MVLETDCPCSDWHIAILPPNSAKRCWAMQTNTWTLCNAKVGTYKHGTPAPTYKGLKKENCSTNMQSKSRYEPKLMFSY